MISDGWLEFADLSESQTQGQVKDFLTEVKQKDIKSHLKYIINKFNQIDPKALHLEPERYGKLLDEIMMPS